MKIPLNHSRGSGVKFQLLFKNKNGAFSIVFRVRDFKKRSLELIIEMKYGKKSYFFRTIFLHLRYFSSNLHFARKQTKIIPLRRTKFSALLTYFDLQIKSNFYKLLYLKTIMAAKAVCVLKSEKVNGVIRFAQEVRHLLF